MFACNMKCYFVLIKDNFRNEMLILFKNIRKLFKYMIECVKYISLYNSKITS